MHPDSSFIDTAATAASDTAATAASDTAATAASDTAATAASDTAATTADTAATAADTRAAPARGSAPRSEPAFEPAFEPVSPIGPAGLLIALGGPVALGAVLGVSAGVGAVVRESIALPLVLLGVTAMMVPALYIGAALVGVAPPLAEIAAAVARGMRACGIALLGLLAPTAFLLATSDAIAVAGILGGAVVAAGVLAGLRALYAELFVRHPDTLIGRLVFAAWAMVSLGIGANLYATQVAG